MANTALNRSVVALLTNKSGGNLSYGDVVVIDTSTASSFTTTTTSGYTSGTVGVILEPNGIASNATGLVAIQGWVPKVNLNTAATVGQMIKTHTVAGQATPHSAPRVSGDFGQALSASATPPALLYGSVVPATGTAADADYGDITVSAGVWTIDNDVVTYAKMQNITATSRILGRKTAGAGDTEECTLSEILDFVGSAAQGDILYRGAATWTRLGAGTSGQFLQTQGAGANPQWATASGGASGLTLVENKVVTAASTTLTFSGLDGDTDRSYLLVYNILAAASGGLYEFRPNGVTTNLTETTYRSNGGGSAVDTPAAWYLGPSSVPANGYLTGFLNFKAAKSIHSVARTRTMSIQGISNANTREIFQGGGLWNESATNLTSIDIFSATALQIADGSNVALYKLAQA